MTRLARVKRLIKQTLVGAVGAVVGAATIYVIQVRRGPSLQAWHTVELIEEFTASHIDQVSTLSSYMELEDRLFAELDAEVFARTGSGPAFRFSRYSTGSLPDPRARTPDWNRTFVLDAEAPAGGILLLHGMSDSPYSLRALGQTLNDAGYVVVGLRLPGHGTAPSELRDLRWEDMAAAVGLAVDHLAEAAADRPLHLVGYSTGAALSVHYALEALDGGVGPVPESLVLISPAMGITPLAMLAKWNVRLSRLPGLEKLAWQNTLPEFDPYKYGSFAVNAGDQVYRLTQTVSERVRRRAQATGMDSFPPVLALASAADATVPVNSIVDRLLVHLSPGRNELVLFDVNRTAAGSTVIVADPAPLVTRLTEGPTQPFGVSLITNEAAESRSLVVRHLFRAADAAEEPLGVDWPRGVFSLSHVALPFPPDDPLYGQRPPVDDDVLFLGQLPVQGERGVLAFPASWLLRLRHNPFWQYLADRSLAWVNNGGARTNETP